MAATGVGAPGIAPTSRSGIRPADTAEAAWLCAIPCLAVIAGASLLLGNQLALLLPADRGSYTFMRVFEPQLRPEPEELARCLIALVAPLLCSMAVASSPRWISRVRPQIAASVAIGTQLMLVAVVAASIVAQYRMRYGSAYFTKPGQSPFAWRYFTLGTLAVAILLTATVTCALRSAAVRRRAGAVLSETPRARFSVTGLAVIVTALWMLHAVHSDAEIGNAVGELRYHLGFTLDETFAVLNGRTPLANFSAQYASLWPFAIAVPMLAFGKTVLTYTVVVSAITGLALVAIYGVLRRACRSAMGALLLYLPFLAMSLFIFVRSSNQTVTVGTYYGTLPLRYAIPYFVAWLTARTLDRAASSLIRTWLLFTIAGIAVLNNADFGVAALGATVAALLWAGPGLPGRASLARLAAALAVGLTTAFALVSLVTLIHAGSLPQLWRLVDYARMFAIGGFGQMPIPGLLGLHLLIYLTYVGAIIAATVRMRRRAPNRVLTGMLAWAGVFGLGAGFYFVGRSHPATLVHEFSAWALTLVLLTILAVRELSARRLRRTAVGALIVLFGFGLAACSLAQAPTPWDQVARLQAPFAPEEEQPDPEPLVPPEDPATRRFVASLADGRSRFVVRHGAPVAILLTTGHRIADAYGVVNVSPYTGTESIQTVQRMEATLDALRDAGGNTVILSNLVNPSMLPLLTRRGFELVTAQGLRSLRAPPEVRIDALQRYWPGNMTIMKWVDTRHLYPRALR